MSKFSNNPYFFQNNFITDIFFAIIYKFFSKLVKFLKIFY